jgi:hypothetical protein
MKQTSIAKEKNKVNNVLLAGLKNLREGISGVSMYATDQLHIG